MLTMGFNYLGLWNPTTNTPTLADGVGQAGNFYIASEAGTVNLGSGNLTFAKDDWALQNASLIWQVIPVGVQSNYTVGTINSATKSANGAVIDNDTNQLIMQTADATYPGLVSTGSQTFAGQKTFSTGITGTLTGNADSATNVAGGTANQIVYNTGAGASSFITAPTVSNTFLEWNGSAFVWTAADPDDGVTTVGTFDSKTPSANGAVIDGVDIVFQSASATLPGMVNTTTQTFAGQKTFSTGITGTLTGNADSATNVAGGAANQIVYNTGAGASSFIVAPTVANTYLEWNGSSFVWSTTEPDTGVTTVGTFDSETPSANGAVIDGADIVFQSASATLPGMVNTTTQTFAGVKTFNSAPNLNSLTASLPLQLDASKNIISSAINLSNSQTTGVITVAKATIAAQSISASNIDWSLGNVFTKTLSSNTTFTFSNVSSGQVIVVRLTNTPSDYTVTWTGVLWSGGTPPVMTTGSATDVYTFVSDGVNVYGSYVQDLS